MQSGPFEGPLAGQGLSAPAVDRQHIASVIFGAPGTNAAIMSVTEEKRGSWGAPARVFSDVTPNYPELMGFEVSGNGHAAVGLLQQNGAGQVSVIKGALGKNHWGKAVDVSQSDNELLDELPYGAQTFGASSAGGLAIAWAYIGGAIRVIARQTSGGAWGGLANRRPGELCGWQQLHCRKCRRHQRCGRGSCYMDRAGNGWLDRPGCGDNKLKQGSSSFLKKRTNTPIH
jgi:hypothetical protein